MMSWLRYLSTFLLVGLLPLSAAQAEWSDEIKSYTVDITVQTDGTLDIHEEIQYSFGDYEPAHGIERFIPTSYSGGLWGDHIDLDLHSVTVVMSGP
jgi:hypothetical protein